MTPEEFGGDVSRETSVRAERVFGDQWEKAARYVEWLRTAGAERGLIGPREIGRLWTRHVLNCAVIADLVPGRATIADVGSGAGLPGIPLALARPDVEVTLIEPLLRRSAFLTEVVDDLDLRSTVKVVRSRAEDLPAASTFDVVTARAVAPMDRLSRWSLPLVRPGGVLLALKGEAVDKELRESAALLETMGAESWRVERVGRGVVDPPTMVAVVRVSATRPERERPPARGRQRRKRR